MDYSPGLLLHRPGFNPNLGRVILFGQSERKQKTKEHKILVYEGIFSIVNIDPMLKSIGKLFGRKRSSKKGYRDLFLAIYTIRIYSELHLPSKISLMFGILTGEKVP